ncbi:MAG TPA: fatty acid desaturase [Acidiferrobacterales bacterium]|nr:fatty acid desaturase [Acidiferrobacterales bacterium]
MESAIARIKRQKRTIINQYTKTDNVKGFSQAITTLVPLAALWYAAVLSAGVSYWLTAGITLVMTLFLLRVFMMMHETGHATLFRTGWLNKAFGFVFGVASGLPTYVWAQHHAYHHATNGNWEKYRGPLNIRSVDEYEAMTDKQQRMYERTRSIWLAPFGGFSYLIFNPRYTWLKGSISLLRYLVEKKFAEPRISIEAHAAEFKTPYWNDATEYWHMFWNNVALLSAWVLMSLYVGPALFFTVYLISLSLAGGGAIVLFTVQHNFDHSYASGTEKWDYDTAAIWGTSFLVLPRWLNWFTANIAYHHVHHLSAGIPNYCLVNCHNEYQDLFTDVTRIKLSRVHTALKYILWDTRSQRIISVAEYRQNYV